MSKNYLIASLVCIGLLAGAAARAEEGNAPVANGEPLKQQVRQDKEQLKADREKLKADREKLKGDREKLREQRKAHRASRKGKKKQS